MLTVRGRYENGQITLLEEVSFDGACEVLVTFLGDDSLIVVPGPVADAAERRVVRNGVALTEREFDVLELLQQGLTNREIALELHLSPGTIRNYTSSIYHKLKVRNRLEAVNRAVALGLLSVDRTLGLK